MHIDLLESGAGRAVTILTERQDSIHSELTARVHIG